MYKRSISQIWTAYFVPENSVLQKTKVFANLDLVFCPRRQCSPKKGLHRISTALFGSENSFQGGTGCPGGHVPSMPPTYRAYVYKITKTELKVFSTKTKTFI